MNDTLRSALGGLVVTALVGLTGCGTETASDAGAAQTQVPPASEYGEVIGAIERANVSVCEPAEGGGYIPLQQPTSSAARERTYFQYLEGRIYEVGPCQLVSGKRNEVRIYRYPAVDRRDAALRDITKRGTRPTSTFAFRDEFAIEIWSPEPSLDSPIGQVAAQVHAAIGRIPQARHLDLSLAAGPASQPEAD